jgi:transcriptional regulator with XRE-family HTH domain
MQLFRLDNLRKHVQNAFNIVSEQEVSVSELAKIRRSKGFTQRSLAELADMSPSSIYEIEVGRRKPNPSTLRRLAAALGVQVVDLLEEEERPKAIAPESPRAWLRAHGALLLTLTEEGLADQFAALYPDDREKFAKRVNEEWRAVQMARDLAEDPNAQLVREAYVHATSRYLQAKALAPISTSYDLDDPDKPEQVTIIFEKEEQPKTSTRSGRKGADDNS